MINKPSLGELMSGQAGPPMGKSDILLNAETVTSRCKQEGVMLWATATPGATTAFKARWNTYTKSTSGTWQVAALPDSLLPREYYCDELSRPLVSTIRAKSRFLPRSPLTNPRCP